MFSRRLVAMLLPVLAALPVGLTVAVSWAAPAAAQAHKSAQELKAELDQLQIDMAALRARIAAFRPPSDYCGPRQRLRAPHQAQMRAWEAEAERLRAASVVAARQLQDALRHQTGAAGRGGELTDLNVYARERNRLMTAVAEKRKALDRALAVPCSGTTGSVQSGGGVGPTGQGAKPQPPQPPQPPPPLPQPPTYEPISMPVLPKFFCSEEEKLAFLVSISAESKKASDNATKAGMFKTSVAFAIFNLEQAGEAVPPGLRAQEQRADAEARAHQAQFDALHRLHQQAAAIPVVDCRTPTQTGNVTAPPLTGTATTPGPRFQSGSLLDDKRNRLFAIVDEMKAAYDRCDPEAYERLLNELREMRSQVKFAAAAATGSAEFSNINPKEAEGLAAAIREVIRPREWQLHDLKRKCRDKTQVRPTTPSQTGFIPPAGSVEGRILDVHNKERAAVGARPLQWDPSLAASASAYAQQLARGGPFVHAPRAGRENERENLSRGLPGASPERMMTNWTNEKSNFIPGTYPDVSKTGSWYDVSHYTQMIWPTTTRVGCGTARGARQEILVCRYTPPGNRPGRPLLANNATVVRPELGKLPVGGGMQRIDPPPPPRPTAAEPAPDGNEARHPLATLFAGALNAHYEALRNCDPAAARRALDEMRYALDELRKRLRAARSVGGFSTVNPDELERLINGLERVLRGAEQRGQSGICPPR